MTGGTDAWQVERDQFARRADRVRGMVDEMIANHTLFCSTPDCPFSSGRRLVITERFIPDSHGSGGWRHRNLTSHIGWIGEQLGHLAVPEICLHGGLGLLTTPMDGITPRGEAEIKTATPCGHTASETRLTFTVRASQRRDHALPCICIALSSTFLTCFHGRRVVLPDDAAELALHVDDIYLIPLAAYPTPERCFILPSSLSAEWPIRAIQTVFRTDLRGLRELGIGGLCRIRALFDAPEKVEIALRYVETLGDALTETERRAYQLNPHRLLADAEAFARGLALNDRVAEALALRTLALRRAQRERERAAAERELEQNRREQQERRNQAIRQELAWAFLGVLTLAAGHPVSAVDMRWKYALRRDTYYPSGFNREASARGIAVCIEGERRRIHTTGGTRERRLTQAERQQMERRLPEWAAVVRRGAHHPFARDVLDRWRERSPVDAVARHALTLLPDLNEAPRQLILFAPPQGNLVAG